MRFNVVNQMFYECSTSPQVHGKRLQLKEEEEGKKGRGSETKPNPASTIPSKPKVRRNGEFPACVWHELLPRQVICSEAEIIKKAELSLGRK